MKKLTVIILLAISNVACMQEIDAEKLSKEINQLISYKIEYERRKRAVEITSDQNDIKKRDKAKKNYTDQFKMIKDNQRIYLDFINSKLQDTDWGYKQITYRNINLASSKDLSQFLLLERDVYNVIKVSVKRDAYMLPEGLEEIDIPITSMENKP